MAVEQELRHLLERTERQQNGDNNRDALSDSAKGGTDVATARVIYERLVKARNQETLPVAGIATRTNMPELLVLTAEAAVRQGDVHVAKCCVEWFLSESNVRNQFYCRMQLVRAHCGSIDATLDCGALKLRKVLNAIRFIASILPIALDPKRRPQYDFLVYNASVTYWQVARQLMKKSTFQYLIPSLNALIDALKAVGEKDQLWMGRLQLTLVYAHIDAKLMAPAVKGISDLLDVYLLQISNDATMSADPAFKTLYEEAVRLQVHLASFKDPECQKLAGSSKKITATKRLTLVSKLQAIKSGSFTGTLDSALTELLQETIGMPTFSPATTTDDQIITHLQSLDAPAQQAVDAEIVVEAGILAAFRYEFRIAACCDVVLQIKGKTMTPKFRVLHQVLKAILLALVPPNASANYKLTRQQRAALVVSRRIEGVKAIERALVVCKMQQDPNLMENVCLYAWNLSQPLLQPSSRSQLSRLFAMATTSMEELQSLQLTLRVRLLLETAKIELSADFVSKAQDNVTKALRLDYGTLNATNATSATAPTLDELTKQESKLLVRPADVHLLPLKNRLDSKLSLEDPSTLEQELGSAVEELKAAKDQTQRRHHADRVIGVVARLQGDRAAASLDTLLHLNAASAIVWHELKDATMARTLAKAALAVFDRLRESAASDPESMVHDKSVRLIEVDAKLRVVETIGHEMKSRAQRYQLAADDHAASQSGKRRATQASKSRTQSRGKKNDDAIDAAALVLLSKESHILGLGAAPTHVQADLSSEVADRHTALEAELLATKKELVQELSTALQAATRIGWGFVVENSVVYVWNYHFHVFRRLLASDGTAFANAILPECIAAFEAALVALEALPMAIVNQDLLGSVALGLATVHEKLGRVDKANAVADNVLKRHKASTAALPTATMSTAAPTLSVMLLKRFTELKVRVQLHQNAKEIMPVDALPALKVVSFLEAMEGYLLQSTNQPPVAGAADKASSCFQKALAAWQPIARESVDHVKNGSLSLEEQQQSLALYCEVWVRLGCGAFRFQNAKQGIDCSERALTPLSELTNEEQEVWVTRDTWKWLAIAELLAGRSMLTLLSGETAAWSLIEAVLAHIVKATQYALRGNVTAIVAKASDVAWNTTLTAIAAVEAERALGEASDGSVEVAAWRRLLPLLRAVLDALGSIPRASHQLGEMALLVLDVYEKASEWKVAVEVAESLMQPANGLLPDHLKDINTFHAIATATLGGSGGSTAAVGKGKDHDALVQAKIWKRIAFSSRQNPPAQLKALAMAFKELDGKPEEQAGLLLDMSEWFYTHHFPIAEVHAHVDSAIATLLRAQSAPAKRATHHECDETRYSSLFFDDKLLRGFVTRAMAATSMPQRWDATRTAMHHVHSLWQCIVDVVNDQDLRERHQQEDPTSDYDEWKADKTTKIVPLSPCTTTQWVQFYQQYASSSTNRFHSSWIAPVAKFNSDQGMQSITNPLLTCDVLERLMELLTAFGAAELLLPVVCLYQVIYHAFSPHKSRTMEMWTELALYDVLERLNLTDLSTPLQSALEMLQTGGDIILKELQQQQHDQQQQPPSTSRYRPVLQLAQVNVSTKAVHVAQQLLKFGFIRQAKVLLALLRNVADRQSDGSALRIHCDALAARVSAIEGNYSQSTAYIHAVTGCSSQAVDVQIFVELVLLQSTLMQDQHKANDLLLEAERVVAQAALSMNDCVLLKQPMHMQAVSKYLSSVASSGAATKTPPGISAVDLDVVIALAQLKFRRAAMMMTQATASRAIVEHAQRVFREAVDLLTLVDSKKVRAELNSRFAVLLISYTAKMEDDLSVTCAQQREHWLLEARNLLQEAATMLETLRSRTFEPPSSSVAYCSPVDATIARTKLWLAKVDIVLEESRAIVTDQQMTWYNYERDAKSTIVDRWLDRTATRMEIERLGSASSAAALAASACQLLARSPEQLETHALAKAVQLYCRWLVLYHSDNSEQRKVVQQWVWTRYTSESAPHETWICAANSGVVLSSGEGRSTPVPPSTEKGTIQEPLDPVLTQTFATLASELDAALKHAQERRDTEAIRLNAYSLVQVYGCREPVLAARALLLYQSVLVREAHMLPLVDACMVPTNVTKLHMRRVDQLLTYHTNAKRNSLPYQLSQLFLEQQSDMYKRMDVSTPVETILSMVPPHTRVLSLQFSPCRCFLYAAFTGHGDKGTAIARMECTTSKLMLLQSLTTRVRAWRQSVTKTLLSTEDTGNTSAPGAANGQSDLSEFTTDAADELESEFNAIVAGTVDFFGSLFDHSAFHAVLQTELVGNALILIVDRELELLPLESLPAFDKADGISREFSIHLLYHRLAALKAQPFRREDTRIIVDPRREDTGLGDQSLTSILHQYTKKSGAAFANWKDAADHGQVPTTTDWQQAMLLRRGGSLCYVGPNRVIGSELPLELLSGMNLAGSCYALLLFDRAENRTSARRQSKLDSEKPHDRLAMEEDTYATALLCSLVGVNVVLMNQWTVSFHANRRLASGVLGALSKGQSIAKSVRRYPDAVVPITVAPLASVSRKASTNAATAAAVAVAPATASTVKPSLKNRVRYATAVFGLGHLSLKGE